MKKIPFTLCLLSAGLLKMNMAYGTTLPLIFTQTPTIPSSMRSGTTYGPFDYTIQNISKKTLAPTWGGIDGIIIRAVPALTNACGATIAPGQRCNMALSIKPSGTDPLIETPEMDYDYWVHTPAPTINVPMSNSPSAAYIMVSDRRANLIYSFTPDSTGVPTYTLGIGGTTLQGPAGLWVDEAENLWVANRYGSGANPTDVLEYPFSAWHSSGDAPSSTVANDLEGQYMSVALGGNGTLYVLNDFNNDVEVFENPIGTLTGMNTSVAFQNPTALWAASSGVYYVADSSANALYQFSANAIGTSIPTQTVTSTSLQAPTSVWVDGSGNIWSVNTSTPAIVEFASNAGSAATAICTLTSANITAPRAIAVDQAGYVYELDGLNNGTINVFAPGSCGFVTPTNTFTLTGGGFSDAVGMTIDDPVTYITRKHE